MPFRLKLRRTRRYNVLSKNYFVTRIRLLDSNAIECTLSGGEYGTGMSGGGGPKAGATRDPLLWAVVPREDPGPGPSLGGAGETPQEAAGQVWQ
ncbi:Tyrosine-protein phosphatase non-receptor type 14 [Larimichthys crocea]|uniref:Uncharacterized protein n=1 Tax=Larimichthys crocea TaxID=215358 RepID=A0ACD3QYN1_LARCR|nr:Tyrosine-protein phosphatase non-receptor type 14 [Larimichthys crocea]